MTERLTASETARALGCTFDWVGNYRPVNEAGAHEK